MSLKVHKLKHKDGRVFVVRGLKPISGGFSFAEAQMLRRWNDPEPRPSEVCWLPSKDVVVIRHAREGVPA